MQPIRLEKNVELCSSVDLLGEGNCCITCTYVFVFMQFEKITGMANHP